MICLLSSTSVPRRSALLPFSVRLCCAFSFCSVLFSSRMDSRLRIASPLPRDGEESSEIGEPPPLARIHPQNEAKNGEGHVPASRYGRNGAAHEPILIRAQKRANPDLEDEDGFGKRPIPSAARHHQGYVSQGYPLVAHPSVGYAGQHLQRQIASNHPGANHFQDAQVIAAPVYAYCTPAGIFYQRPGPVMTTGMVPKNHREAFTTSPGTHGRPIPRGENTSARHNRRHSFNAKHYGEEKFVPELASADGKGGYFLFPSVSSEVEPPSHGHTKLRAVCDESHDCRRHSTDVIYARGIDGGHRTFSRTAALSSSQQLLEVPDQVKLNKRRTSAPPKLTRPEISGSNDTVVANHSHPPRPSSLTPDTEIDRPLTELVNSVLVEQRPDDEGLHTLTAICLEAMDLAHTKPGSEVVQPNSPTNHTTVWQQAPFERQERQIVVPNVHGPIDMEDGIPDAQAAAYQSLIPEDPVLRPLPGSESECSPPKLVYWCRSCRVTFKWRRHLEHHFLSHRTAERPSVCHICGKCFTRGDHLNRHASMHNLMEYACQLCGQRFVRASHLELHWASDHSRYIHQTPSVGRQHEAMFMQTSHEYALHPSYHPYTNSHYRHDSDLSDNGSSSPEHDHYTRTPLLETPPSSSNESLHTHPTFLDRPTGSPTHSDEGCPEEMIDNIDVVTKISTVKIGSGPRPYRCQVCARAFNRLAHLQRHHRVHLGEKPLRCSLCGRSYSTADQLKTHVIMQHDSNVINCKTCGKEFSTMGALTNHQKVHQREQNRAEASFMVRPMIQH